MPRPRLLAAALLMLGAAACREADLAPLRADLATSAASVCAPPVPRPAHVAPARFVGRAELDGALVKLCEQNEAHSAASPELLDLLHQGLAQDTALAGDLRRSRLLLELPKVDLGAVRRNEQGVRTAEEALAKTASMRCNAAWVGLDRLLLVAARAQHEAGHHAEAFALCADVVALARDEDLAGGLTDLLLANAEIQRMVQACRPMLRQAPPEALLSFAQALAALRPTFPPNLEAVLRRDHAEQVLYTFGKGRDPAQALGCERAASLAAAGDGRPLTRGDRVDLEHAWQATRKSAGAPNDTFLEAYDVTLRLLDSLVAQARGH